MAEYERRLLDKDDLTKLYELTNPKLNPKPTLHTVISYQSNEWVIEDSHQLRGYRASKASLAMKVRKYEAKKAWPSSCRLGIGVFEADKLIHVLIAKNLGKKPIAEAKASLPLDDVLGAIGLSRSDVLRNRK
ncbi:MULTISPECIES: hypothetical protein [unclassified Pseudoalteromonas]|uniref:hypothetical protein n=1 Tax=unclassified Pseudoalteromonas TaxID=194690 RepID=UPI00160476FE|nr:MULTISPECIES: hypothetical protein [unclassified Pseudoalteromonas]MBB1294656.1 hypothetical protein [Pseudoalteromonas sp. SR41-4]MBB1333946.1 hypothetical protein [Pseudoalteromonas sp. SR41-6]MBB1410235.1 hypothetical protein [Pseudoalteromonas sp. SG44-17]MBB1471098.1 hypothetical protein [Pseudoalteromonas sp. SG41-5]